jgi:hypothetical protein
VSTNGWSRRAVPVAAVALGALTLGSGLATLPLDRVAHQPEPRGPLTWLFTFLVLVPGVVVGTLLAARRPRNPIGWILLASDLTLAAFASRLKDAVDLDSVREDLAAVVQKALEPAHISVWMNERGETR